MSRVASGEPRRRVTTPGLALTIALLVGVATLAYSRFVGPLDLMVYRAGALNIVQGEPLYDHGQPGVWLPFTYPPIAAACFLPLAILPVSLASGLALALSVGCGLRVLYLLLRHTRTPVVAAASLCVALLIAEPVRTTLSFGQVNLILMWLLVEDRFGAWRTGRFSGLATGLAAGIKLTPAIFIVADLARSHTRRAKVAGIALAAMTILPVLIPTMQAQHYWRDLAFSDTRVGGVAYVSNQSLNGLIWRVGGSGGNRLAWLAGCTVVAVMLVTIWRRWRAHPRADLITFAATALGMLLISPISWSHHWVWSMPMLVLLAYGGVGMAPLADVARWTLVVGYLAITVLGVIYWVPNEQDREYLHSPWQMVAGNSYLIWALLTLGLLVVARPPASAPEPPSTTAMATTSATISR